jgi:hypothetical protein
MNSSSSTNDLRSTPPQGDREDNLDRLLSDYFKSKMRQPWPAAPATTARVPLSEPSVLVASRTAANATVESPRNQPASAGSARDGGSKSRYTLAVSVAVLLGTCWYLSNTSQPGERAGPGGSNAPKLNVFPEAGANDPAALKEIRKDKAERGNQGVTPRPKIQLP